MDNSVTIIGLHYHHCQQHYCQVSPLYNTAGNMVYASEFSCGIYIGIFPPLIHIEQFGHLAYMWHLRGILVSGTYLIIWEVAVAAGCILVNMGKYVGSMCLCSILAVWLIFAMWQWYLCCNVIIGVTELKECNRNPAHWLFRSSGRQSFEWVDMIVLPKGFLFLRDTGRTIYVNCSEQVCLETESLNI